MDNRRGLLAIPLSWLNIIGSLREEKLSNIICLIIAITVSCVLFAVIELILQFYYIDGNAEQYLRNYNGITILVQALTKWFICLYHKKKLMNLIKYTDRFWNPNECSESTKRNIKMLSDRMVFAQKIYSTLMMLASILGIMVSLYTRELIFGYWNMEKQYLFPIVFTLLNITVCPLTFPIAGFDCLFLGICFEFIIECKILYNRLELLSGQEMNRINDSKSYFYQVKKCIEHHILLLRFHSDMQSTFSISLLAIYITVVPYIIVQLFAFSMVFSIDSARTLASISCGICQISLYCLAANQMSNELSLISEAAYNSAWYSYPSSMVRTSLVLMIQRAQQDATLTGCGLVEFNIEALVKILKFAASTGIAFRNMSIEENK